MPLAITISLERELTEDYAAYMKAGAGKALARELEKLDFAARVVHVTGITAQLSESQAALIAQLKEEGFDPAKMRLAPEAWFLATDGLTTIRALHGYVSAKLNDFKQPNPILRDLKSAEALLTAAEKGGLRFHFTKTNL